MDTQHPSQRPLAPLLPAGSEKRRLGDLPVSSTQEAASASALEQNPDGPQRKRVACSECRQAKLRCDRSNDPSSQSCSRCRRMALDCHVDLGYKRVNKRLKINELAEQVERLSSVVGSIRNNSSHDHEELSKWPSPNVGDSSGPIRQTGSYAPSSLSPPSVSSGSHHITPIDYQRLTPSKPRVLENIELTGQQINLLFREFFEHYHYFLEILDPSVTPDQYYSRSPLLFWCIISVASRRYADDISLLAALNPSVSKLVWNSISTRPISRYLVHSLLLISTWSFPTSSLSTDQSSMFCSIAKTAAVTLGLHRPETVQDFRRVKTQFGLEEFQDAMKVWAGCYITAQGLSATIGQAGLFSDDDWAINRACDPGTKYTLPENMRHILLIHRFLAKVNKTMAENSRSPNGFPSDNESYVLMTMLERDFIDLERQISSTSTDLHKLLLLTVLLQLRVYYFFMPTEQPIRREGLLKAYATALELIREMYKMDTKSNLLLYVPNNHSYALTVSGMMIMKIINSSYSHYVDVEEGKKAFNNVVTMLRKASVEDNDLRGRVSKIISQLWGLHHSLNLRKESDPVIRLKSRRSASLLHDSLWMWREEFGGQRFIRPRQVGVDSSAGNDPVNQADTDDNREREEIQRSTTGDSNGSNTWNSVPADDFQRGAQAFENAEIMMGNEFGSFDDLNQGLEAVDWMWDFGFPPILPTDDNSYNMPL